MKPVLREIMAVVPMIRDAGLVDLHMLELLSVSMRVAEEIGSVFPRAS